MILIILISGAVLNFAASSSEFGSDNKFVVTAGCRQYNSNKGYNDPHSYFPTAEFRNIKQINGKILLRMGVMGEKNSYIRFAPNDFPYSNTQMHEIAFHCHNACSTIKQYKRTSAKDKNDESTLVYLDSPNLMSIFEPLMFTVEIGNGGDVTVTRDNHVVPLLTANNTAISANYIGFTNWDVPVVFFFDCPLF